MKAFILAVIILAVIISISLFFLSGYLEQQGGSDPTQTCDETGKCSTPQQTCSSGKCPSGEQQSQPCSDGTAHNQCSLTRPEQCQNGTLIDKCTQCGCAPGTLWVCNQTSETCYKKQMFATADFATIEGCEPYRGAANAPLKILFISINNTPQFDTIVDTVIEAKFESISPFKENINSIAFYKVSVNDDNITCKAYESGPMASGFSCSNVLTAVNKICRVNDYSGIMSVALVKSDYSGGFGIPISVGVSQGQDLQVYTDSIGGVVMHELGHGFGLVDLYYGMFYFDGRPAQFMDTNFSRAYPNADGPGCPKWCQSYKPVSEYTQSLTAPCVRITTKEECVSFGRHEETYSFGTVKTCDVVPNNLTNEMEHACCVWSNESFEYFNSYCVPAWGMEDIGIGCLEGTGCYFGAVYGNYAWRPVLRNNESIMYSSDSVAYDPASLRQLNKIFECCLVNPTSSNCADFRQNFSDFLEERGYQKRIGSCGYPGHEITS